MIITPKNWNTFQHYKDREPSWIKLHKSLLTNYEFVCLPVASKALAPMLWLLASEYKDGIIDASLDKIAFRLSMTRSDLADALSPLIQAGFFDASEPLAERKQIATLEKEREIEDIEKKEEKEKETREVALSSDPLGFHLFWDIWPNKVGKPAALKALKSALKRVDDISEILDGVRAYIRDKPPDRPWLNPATFLNQDRWKDRPAKVLAKPISAFERKRNETQEILDDLHNFSTGSGRGGQENHGILAGDPGERPEGIRGGTSANVIDLPASSYRASG